MNILDIARNIEKDKQGIYKAKDTQPISYPEEGNEMCMQIEQDSFWFNHRNDVIASAVQRFSPHATFFDIGGGNGFVAMRLQAEGLATVLVEPGPQGARNAKSRNIQHVICSTLEAAGFLPNSIEAAGMFDVVEHIEDDIAFLSNTHHYLKEGGHLYITVPAYRALWSNEDDDAGHFRRYTIRQMRKKLEQTGFEIVYTSYIFSILPLPILLFRSIPSRLGFNKKSQDLDKHQKEHSNKKGLLSRIFDRIWAWEIRRIQKGKRIGFGGSCFVVAKKINSDKPSAS